MDFSEQQVFRAFHGTRQPGSSVRMPVVALSVELQLTYITHTL